MENLFDVGLSKRIEHDNLVDPVEELRSDCHFQDIHHFLLALGEHLPALSKRLNINPSTATRRVNRLLTDDLVTKSIAPGDERRYDLRLTDKGARFLDQMDEWVYQTIQKTYEPVTDEELRVVYQYMEKCISQLQRLGAGE